MAVLFARIDDRIRRNTAHIKKPASIIGMIMMVIVMLPSLIKANDLFPIPPQIEKNVDFWTKIYSQYSSNHVVVHDKNDLSVIYTVINLNEFYTDSIHLSVKWDVVEEVKSEYRRILQKLSEINSPPSLDSLSKEERHVFILWSHSDDPYKFSKARYAVRAQLGLRDRFRESIKRSGYYKENIDRIFKYYDLPLELTYLPHVESLFDYTSYSKVGAAGIWQFIYHTGRLFMNVNYAVDERLDPITATDGAARLLKKNYKELQSWPLAITAYNHGLNGMRNAKTRLKTDDFGVIYEKYQSPMFGFASKNFYAEFLAARHVAANYKAYFGAIEPYPSKKYQSIKLQEKFYIKQLATHFKVPIDTLIAYNPAFRRAVISNATPVPRGYVLRLPYREGFDPREALVQRTKPLPPTRTVQRKPSKPILLTQNLTGADSLTNNTDMEEYILRKLQSETTPPLVDETESDPAKALSTNVQAN